MSNRVVPIRASHEATVPHQTLKAKVNDYRTPWSEPGGGVGKSEKERGTAPPNLPCRTAREA